MTWFDIGVRLADTLVEVTRVAAHERYVCPLWPGIPLVDRGIVRIPIGIDPIVDDGRTTLRAGLVTITIERIAEKPVALPRPRASRRLVPFFAAALVAHVALVSVALATENEEPITIPVVRAEAPRTVPTVKLPEPKPKKQKKPAAKAAASTAVVTATEPPPTTTPTEARHSGILGSANLDALVSRMMGSKDLAQELADVGPIYDEAAANAGSFGGGGGAFRPEDDPAFDSVKTGRYATNGNSGANYRLPPSASGKFREVERPPIMGLTCDDGACKTDGELDRFTIRDYVEKRYVDMVKCYERHARGASRIELTLRFDIGDDGKPNEVHSQEESAFGSCLVRLVERVKFPSAKPTQVTYPIAFWRS